MDRSHLHIASLNSRGHASDRIEYINRLMSINDILFIQEHWYSSSQLNDLESKLDNVHVIGISGMDDNELLYGRPYGGCAIIFNNQLKCTVTPVKHDSKRCMAAVITVNTCCFLFFNIYMPCDMYNNQHDNVYDDILQSINLVINQFSEINHIVICGDLNTDISRLRSSHTTRTC